MTDAIDELERLHAESTSGEWSNRDGRSYGIDADEEPVFESENSRDAAAIVALHNAFPALLAYVRALEAVCAQAVVGNHTDGASCELCDAINAVDAARARLNGGK